MLRLSRPAAVCPLLGVCEYFMKTGRIVAEAATLTAPLLQFARK
ncbi:hypothetical protein [Uruburuella testudinis]|nr:hypothetical protein [Uruburuella testudinis]